MTKPTQEQLDSIKNAKTGEESEKAYGAIMSRALEEYEAIQELAREVYGNGTPPKPDKKEKQ